MLTEYTHLQLFELNEKQLENRLEQRRRHMTPRSPRWRNRAARALNRLADRLDDRLDDRASATSPRLTSR